MKKKLASIALIAMSLVALPSVAQDKTDNKADGTCTGTYCLATPDAKRPQKACPFDGMNLTDAQKTQLQELDKKQQEARKARVEAFKQQAKEAKNEMKANRALRDSTAMEARKADRKAYLEQVKAIVGPENYLIFLENSYINAGGPGFKGAPRKGGQFDKAAKSRHDGEKALKARADRPARDGKARRAAVDLKAKK